MGRPVYVTIMLIASLALANEAWNLVKFGESANEEDEIEDEFGPFPLFFSHGLPSHVEIEDHDIPNETDHIVLVGIYPFADKLYMWLSDRLQGGFQITITYKSGYDDPVATAIFFQSSDDRDMFMNSKKWGDDWDT